MDGTAEQPVSFSSTHSAGWSGISVQTGGAALLEHCTLNAPGRSQSSGLHVAVSSFVARHLTVAGGAGTGTGIDIAGAGNTARFETVTVTGCTGAAVRMGGADMNPFFSGVTFTGNGTNGVHVVADTSGFANVFRAVEWTMTGAPYIIGGWYRLGENGVLNIGPGVRVEFAPSPSAKQSTLAAMDLGELNVLGTAEAPVTFTSHQAAPAPGDWAELAFNEGSSGALQHCVVEYAGQWSPQSIRVAASDVTLDHVEVRDGVGNGIVLDEPEITPTLDNLEIHDTTGWALVMQTQNMNPAIGDNLVFTNNPAGDAIAVSSDTSSVNTVDVTWTVNGTPYVIIGWYWVGDGTTFTILPGVEVRMAPNPSAALQSNIDVQPGGAMIAAGLPQNPIVFNSWEAEPAAGDWAFIRVQQGASGNFAHCRVWHAGAWNSSSVIIGSSDVSVSRTVIRQGQGNGIRLENAGITPTLRDIAVSGCTGWGIWQQTVNMAPLYRNISLAGNTAGDAILISAPTADNTVTQDQIWGFAGAPYALSGWFQFVPGTELYINPGVVLQFTTAPAATQTYIQMKSGCAMYATGRSDRRIVFTSDKTPQNAADWVSLILEDGSTAQFDYCTIEYPITALDIQSSNVEVSNSILRVGRDFGVWVRNDAQPTFANNHVEGFNHYGFLSWTPGSVVDMRNHWWGDPSGPYHATLNTAGLGNRVSDGVLFEPWAAAPLFGATAFAWPHTTRVELSGGAGFISVSNTGAGDLTWGAGVTSGQDWLSIDEDAKAEDGFTVTAEPYTGDLQRVGIITLTSNDPEQPLQTLYVAQPGVLGEEAGAHTADHDASWDINLSELLRMIQFYNSDGFHCDAATEDGYAPGPGDTTCALHASDYNIQDWAISLSELLRIIQFFNSESYFPNADGEDGFSPGAL